MEFQKDTIQNVTKESSLREIVKFTIFAVIITLVVRTYIAQPFIVSGASMDPTFHNMQYLIVDQLTYNFYEPKRDDVVIFKYPNNPKIFYIKRIIGLPGEKVEIANGVIRIINKENPDGMILDDTHVSESKKSHDSSSVVLRNNEYFVMGDNRKESSDSRVWGPLERKYIVGRPFLRLYPVSKISVFPGK
jgi:signal peptidase I